jgi:uncharacterized membrane protein
MLHPATVHFAIVLPVIAAAFGIAYMISKKESLSKIAARTTLVAAIAMIVVWYTGDHAGPLIYKLLSPEGQHELLEHKELGKYLAIAMVVIALLQIIGCKMKKFALEAFAILLLIVAMFFTFSQGKDGGELVYKYGKPFQMNQLTNYLNSSDDLDMADDVDQAVDLIKEKATAISKKTPSQIQGKK